jgi:hypothetical protein
VENFRSANAFLVEPPQFNAALVGMQMSAGVRFGRAAASDGGEPAGMSSVGADEAMAGPSHDTSVASTDGGTDAGGDARRVTFSSPGEEGVSVHASDQELSADSSSSSDEAPSESAEAAGGGASDGGSPAVPSGRVQRAVEKLEGGVTAETCRVAYRRTGVPAAPVEAKREPASPRPRPMRRSEAVLRSAHIKATRADPLRGPGWGTARGPGRPRRRQSNKFRGRRAPRQQRPLRPQRRRLCIRASSSAMGR